MVGVDDGIWTGNLDAADFLFAIAAVLFFVAAILPHVRHREGVRDFGVSLVPLGLCLMSIALLVL